MFKTQPMLYYVVPKNKHYILSGLATLLIMFGCAILGLSIGTDHWREAKDPGYNVSVIFQGLIHECDKTTINIKCKKVINSKFSEGLLGTLEIIYALLVGSLVIALLALISSFLASFHKKHILVTAVVAMEVTSALISIFGISLYAHYFFKDYWKVGWSFFLASFSSLSFVLAPVCHYVIQDVKFLGKKICI